MCTTLKHVPLGLGVCVLGGGAIASCEPPSPHLQITQPCLPLFAKQRRLHGSRDDRQETGRVDSSLTSCVVKPAEGGFVHDDTVGFLTAKYPVHICTNSVTARCDVSCLFAGCRPLDDIVYCLLPLLTSPQV